MTTRYTFTLRPPGQYTCPEGWIPDSWRFTDPSRQWDHGSVEYPEPLSFKDADHYSLDPAGPKVCRLVIYGNEYGSLTEAIGSRGRELAYDLAIGKVAAADIFADLSARCDEFDLALVLEVTDPDGTVRTFTRESKEQA